MFNNIYDKIAVKFEKDLIILCCFVLQTQVGISCAIGNRKRRLREHLKDNETHTVHMFGSLQNDVKVNNTKTLPIQNNM